MSKLERALFALRPEEAIALVFFLPSMAITLRADLLISRMGQGVPPRIVHGLVRLAVTAGLGALYAIALRLRAGWRESPLRDLMPFAFCIAIYTNLHDTIHFVNPHDVHDRLIAIDRALFGVQPCLWAQRFYQPWLTDLFSVAYMNYFLLSLSVVTVLLVQKRRAELREALFGTVLCFYFGYVLYLVFPAAPPWQTLAHEFTRPLTGHWVTQLQHHLAQVNPTSSRGAFPSLHCAITLITLLYARKFERRLFWVLVLPGVTLVASTIYLRHHYGIDLIAGFALALFTYAIAPALDAAWMRARRRRVEPVPSPAVAH